MRATSPMDCKLVKFVNFKNAEGSLFGFISKSLLFNVNFEFATTCGAY